MTEIEPLEDDILALVAAAKRVPEIDPARKADIFAATAARIGALPPDGGTDGGGSGGGGAGGAGAATGAAAGSAVGGLGKIALAMITFVVGIGVGVVADRTFTKERAPLAMPAAQESVATGTVPAVGVRPAEVQTVSPGSLPDAPPQVATAIATARASASGEAPSSRGLAAERALLDVARSALARGEPTEALVATARHAREYPEGTLVEEREAIAIKALVALGRRDEARTRLHSLEQRFPNGLSVRAVKATVDGPP